MLKYILFAIIGISQCYSMVQNNDNIIIEAINNKEELQKGLNLYFEIFYKLRKKEILTKEQEDAIEEQRKNSLAQLLSIPNRNDVFVKQNNDIIIGFLASHLAVKDPSRVIFDNAFFDGKPEVSLQVYEKLLAFVKKTYPQAEKIWFGFFKNDVNNFPTYNFQESDYLDEFHQNKNVWQGWERKID